MRFHILATLALALAGAAGIASAAETPADWLRRPTPEDLLAVWPTKAMENGVGGQATISCQVSLQGALFDCVVVKETPADMGFGRAAIALTPQLLMKPATKDGKPVVSSVRIPVNFSNPGAETGTHIRGDRTSPASIRQTILTNVRWSAAPDYSQVAAAYPPKASATGTGGRATLDCLFKAEGKLGSCDVAIEEPRGQGFAAAARRLTGQFVGPAVMADGRSTAGARTHIPFVFAPEMLDPKRRVIGKPQWAALPSGDAMTSGYPVAAVSAGVKQARVVLRCVAGPGGKLEGCEVQSEEPAALGFGAAALNLGKSFRMQPWTAEGLPVIGGNILVPIRYMSPDVDPAPAAKP